MSILTVTDLSKVYRRIGRPSERAVDHLTLDVGEGGVFGFLGPNGSGKTTTIRMLLGLTRPTSGSMTLLGQPVPSGLAKTMPQVGSLVELPTLFPNFTGRENLRLLALTAGLPKSRVDECLDVVGLRDRAKDRVRGYSLGMRQRLAIAAALLKKPRLLILDEPTNGLDPAGIREVRNLIRDLGDGGHTTVFLSSHLLGEVQQTCDHVAILSRGRCVTNGPVAEVLAAGASQQLRVRVPDLSAGAAVLAEKGLITRIDAGTLVLDRPEEPADVTRILAEAGIYLSELTPISQDLETVFLSLTGADDSSAPKNLGPETP